MTMLSHAGNSLEKPQIASIKMYIEFYTLYSVEGEQLKTRATCNLYRMALLKVSDANRAVDKIVRSLQVKNFMK